jgi:type I restriction enzyme, S subunit
MLKTRWPAVPIEELCVRVTSGGTPSRSNPAYYDGGSVPWIKTGELRGWYVDDVAERITPAAVRESSAKVFPPETVLLAMYGDGKTMGSVGLIRTAAATNQACCAMLADPQKCDPKYLMYSLVYYRPAILKLAISGAQRNLNGKSIRQFTIGAPPIKVQHRVTSILSAYDHLIENNTRRIAIVEEMARRMYEEWFVRFRFPGHEGVRMVESELGFVPEGWVIRGFDEIATFTNGFAFKPEHLGTEGAPVVKIKELKAGVQADTPRFTGSLPDRYRIKHGDILFSWSADLDAYIWGDEDGWLNQHLFLVDALGPATPRSYLFHALKTAMPSFRTRSNGATMKHIKRSALSEVKTAVPQGQVAAAFDQAVGPLHELVKVLSRSCRNLRTTRDLLLTKLISGELDVCAMPGPEAVAA